MICRKKQIPEQRKIFFQTPIVNPADRCKYQTDNFRSNYIRTTKYTFWTFLPLVLLFEISKISNMYFILMAIINIVPQIQIFSAASSIFPVILILAISLIKQFIETISAYLRDKTENNKKCRILNANGNQTITNFGSLEVGNVVILSENDYIPADCILISTSLAEGQCYMETSSLDGEKNLKCRQTIKETFNCSDYDKITDTWKINCSFEITCSPPEQNLSKFTGFVNFFNNGIKSETSVDLTIKNFLYKGSSVKIVKSCLALVVYTGIETKIQLNLQRPHNKKSLLEKLINWKVFYLALIQITTSLIFVIFKATTSTIAFEINIVKQSPSLLLTFFQYIILMSNLVPISLFVNIEIIRLIQGLFMHVSLELESVITKKKVKDSQEEIITQTRRCEINNFTLSDELGRVEFILTDKTGTLTKNNLTLDALWVGGDIFGGKLVQESENGTKFEKFECQLNQEDLSSFAKDSSIDFKFTFYDKQLFFGLDSNAIDQPLEEKYQITAEMSNKDFSMITEQNQNVNSMIAKNMNVLSKPEITSKLNSVNQNVIPKQNDIEENVGENDLDISKSSSEASFNEIASQITNPMSMKVFQKSGIIKEFTMRSEVQKEMIRALVMCHSCMAQKKNNSCQIKYSGQSPDEVAILKGLRSLGLDFLGDLADKRTYNSMTQGIFKFPKVLDMEFSSERAMQSIVFRDERTGLYFMYCKGSDTKIMSICNDAVPKLKAQALKVADEFSRLGYRTLFYGFRYFTEEQWTSISSSYGKIKNKENGCMTMNEFCANLLETNVYFLGFVVIQDELQAEVSECIEKLRNAEIKLWVVTGDKFETAITISKSASVVSENENLVRLKNGNDPAFLDLFFEEIRDLAKDDFSIVIDMSNFSMTLFAEHPELKEIFLKARSVICSRSSPLVKGQLVKLLKKEGKCVLGIGDGENDVNMISEANIGVGVFGKEGTQATKVSDIAIGEFKILWKLILFYGRINYMRTSNYVILYLFKNMILVGIQFIFGFFSLASGTSFLDSWFLSVYNSFLNAFPHFYIGIFDVDIHYIKKVDKPRGSNLSIRSSSQTTAIEDISRGQESQTNFLIRKIIMDNYWILFHESQLNRYFSESLFWANILYGAFLSTVIVIFSYFQIANECPGSKALGFGEFTLGISLILVVTVNISYMLRAKCLDDGIILTVLFLSIVPAVIYTIIYDKIFGTLIFKELVNLFSNGQFYLAAVILIAFYIIFEILFHIVLDEVNQPFYYKLLAMEKSKILSQKLLNLKRIVKKRRVYFNGNFKTKSGVSFLHMLFNNKEKIKYKGQLMEN